MLAACFMQAAILRFLMNNGTRRGKVNEAKGQARAPYARQ
jgi:hypothetical protein